MFDREKGLFPPGVYIVGEDLEQGRYLFEAERDMMASVSIFTSYESYLDQDSTIYNSFEEDYHLVLKKDGMVLEAQNCKIKKL